MDISFYSFVLPNTGLKSVLFDVDVMCTCVLSIRSLSALVSFVHCLCFIFVTFSFVFFDAYHAHISYSATISKSTGLRSQKG